METKITPPWTKGVLICLVCIIYGLTLYFTKQTQNKALGWVQFVILVSGVIWSCIQFAKQMEGNVTYGNVFSHGFKVTAATAALLAVYTFISFKFIFPEMIDISIEEARKNMEAKGNLSDEQVQQSVTMVKKFFIPFAIGGALIATAIIGLIASLVGAAIAKKNPNYTPLQ